MTAKHHRIPPPSDASAPDAGAPDDASDLHRVHRELSELIDRLEQRAYPQADIRELIMRIRDTALPDVDEPPAGEEPPAT